MENQRKIYSVSQLNRASKRQLEQHFGLIWLQGEISNLSMPSSGHWYFTLKDNTAQIRCAMFRGSNRFVTFRPEHGQQILVRAKVTLYEPRGDYQIGVEYMELAGTGNLQLQFEQLKTKLAQQGLFAAEHKKPIPSHIERVAVITSATGAALHDILSVLKRRDPLIEVTVYPTQVQGTEATIKIVAAIDKANQRNEEQVIILGRGGGSLEDLWCFNEEQVAHAIFNSTLPIISAVGHEVDFTIADFVADERAPTPSAAAERVSTDIQQSKTYLQQIHRALVKSIRSIVNNHSQSIDFITKSLTNPKDEIIRQKLRFEQLHKRISLAMAYRLERLQDRQASFEQQLISASPQRGINEKLNKLKHMEKAIVAATRHQIETNGARLQLNAAKLNTVSPLATLERGYSITKSDSGNIVKSINQIKTGETISTMLVDGEVKSRIL